MKKCIDDIISQVEKDDLHISYSIGLYALAFLVEKKIIAVEEIITKIIEVEKELDMENKTENKTPQQLDEIKKVLGKIIKNHSIVKIECTYVEQAKDYYLGIVFNNDTYATIKSYESIEKIKEEAKKIIFKEK